MVSGSGIQKKVVVVDARHHMLGRLASIISKELLNGQRVVSLVNPLFIFLFSCTAPHYNVERVSLSSNSFNSEILKAHEAT